MMEQAIVEIKGEYITLAQLLKELGLISTGGAAKFFVKEFPITVDGELENRRGRKLYPGMSVTLIEQAVRVQLLKAGA